MSPRDNVNPLFAVVVFSFDEEGSGFAAIRRSDNTGALHAIEQAGCTTIADAQAALKRRG